MEQVENKDPIDLVYLWCDGDDPVWLAKKQQAMQKAGILYNPTSDATGDLRYKQFDELRYSLRSVNDYIPWINHIYIVTDNQKPHWFRHHPKITVVDHKEIMPNEILPTFSSTMIEMYIHQIPRLSEKFLYANDDFFFNCPCSAGDFFSADKPIVWTEKWNPFGKQYTLQSVLDLLGKDEEYSWVKLQANAWSYFCRKNDLNENTCPILGTIHSIESFTKRLFSEILKKYPEIQERNAHPFRKVTDLQRILLTYELIHIWKCKTRINPRRTKLNRFKSRFTDIGMFAILSEKIAGFREELNAFKPRTFCLNNIQQDQQQELQAFLEEKFPNPAPWES